MSDPAGRAARRAYRPASRAVRAHVAGRWWTCPFAPIADALVGSSHVLEIGCGHGLFSLYLASRDPVPRVVGVDIDGDKLVVARAAAVEAGLDARVGFGDVAPDWSPAVEPPVRPPAGWEGIAIVDVLYLLGHERAVTLLGEAAAVLAPGGRLAVKELDTTPAWKHRLSELQELVATRVVRITKGDHVEQIDRHTVADTLASAGLEVTTVRLDRGRVHPDYLVVGTRG